MPLWVKPRTKVSIPRPSSTAMRDHYEGTPMDMTAGHRRRADMPCPYRWRPMDFEVDGVNLPATSVRRPPSRPDSGSWHRPGPGVPDDMGILWFGVDDAATSCLTPIYCSAHRGSRVLPRGQRLDARIFAHVGVLALQPRNQLRLSCVTIMIAADIRKVVDKWENDTLGGGADRSTQPQWAISPKARQKRLTREFSVDTAQQLFDRWHGTQPVPAGEIHGRQREERTRRRATSSTATAARRISSTTATGTTDSRQDPVPGLQREVETRRSSRPR